MSELVPFVDLARIHRPLAAELRAAFDRLLAAGDFTLGAAVERFERAFAEQLGTRFAVGVGSGTAAIELALRAAGIGPGDEVLVPAHTYIASALGVIHAGARPVLCEVEAASGLIDLDAAAAAGGERTAALLAVHLYGQCCDLEALLALCERRGWALIEDAAQAHGASWRGRSAGTAGLAGAFSFYPSKNLGAFGDGGIILSDDEQLAAAARRLRNLGQERKGEHAVAGFNQRLDTLQAAVLEVKLPHLGSWNRSRRRAAARYAELLSERLGILPERDGGESVHHVYPIRDHDRDGLAAALRGRGIGIGVHYALPLHLQPPLTDLAAPGSLPEAERWARTELSLPIFAGIEPDEVERVAAALLELRG